MLKYGIFVVKLHANYTQKFKKPMKAALNFTTKTKAYKNGFPIFITLYNQGKRHKQFIDYSTAAHWDPVNNVPFKQHPNFNVLMPVILELHAKIKSINLGLVNYADAVALLFKPAVANGLEFYTACLQFCDATTNGKLYKTVLNSFNAVYPGIFTTDITHGHAVNYMRQLLKTNSNNGVHTYMRTLNALYNKISEDKNPFKGVRPKKVKTKNKALTEADVLKLMHTRSLKHKYDGHNTNDTVNYYRYYWLLMFYLGGIDFIDLAHLRYDLHIKSGRVQFYRNKGGTNVFINNKVMPQATAILKHFNCYPYLVPIYKYKDHNGYLKAINQKAKDNTQDLNLTRPPLTKSARYTFITRAQQLLIDERITIEIVGHSQQSTHSIYTDAFTTAVRDRAHERIITL